MVFRHVERGEIVEIVLDLGSVGDGEAERAEQRLTALQRARQRMQAADAAAAAGQRYVERFCRKLRGELRVRERRAARGQRLFERRFGRIDARAGGGALGRRELAESLQLLGERPGLAEIFRLRVLERGRIGACRELGECAFYDSGEVIQACSNKKGRRFRLPARFSTSNRRALPAIRS